MKMELIQPFINSADSVLGQSLGCETQIGDVSMEEEVYRRKGVAALVNITGDIEGRVIFDMDAGTATRVAAFLTGAEAEGSDDIVRETVCELANMVVGSAVSSLNDQGVHFKISPPEIHTSEDGLKGSEDTEALVMCFHTTNGDLFMNIAMRYNRRRRNEPAVMQF